MRPSRRVALIICALAIPILFVFWVVPRSIATSGTADGFPQLQTVFVKASPELGRFHEITIFRSCPFRGPIRWTRHHIRGLAVSLESKADKLAFMSFLTNNPAVSFREFRKTDAGKPGVSFSILENNVLADGYFNEETSGLFLSCQLQKPKGKE